MVRAAVLGVRRDRAILVTNRLAHRSQQGCVKRLRSMSLNPSGDDRVHPGGNESMQQRLGGLTAIPPVDKQVAWDELQISEQVWSTAVEMRLGQQELHASDD